MKIKVNYAVGMPTLWRHPKYRTYYARWQENKKNRRKALCVPGTNVATKDPKEAKRLFARFQRELLAGKVVPIRRGVPVTVNQFIDEFLEYCESKVSGSTYYLYEVALNKAKVCWGDVPLSTVSERHFDKLMSDMSRGGLKTPTINKNYRHVKSAIKKAISWGYITHAINFPKQWQEEESVRYIPQPHLRRIMSEIQDPEFYDFCLFAGYTGMRSSEIIRLEWCDVDRPEGYIRITSAQKNKKESTIPINKTAREIIDRCEERRGQKPFRFKSATDISHYFKAAVRAAGYEEYRFHDLRHTFASYLAMDGKQPKAIQKLCRHKSFVSTEKYLHLSDDHLKEVSDSLNLGLMVAPKSKK